MSIKTLIHPTNLFYPNYLKAYSYRTNRTIHFMGTTLFFTCIIVAIVTAKWYWLLIAVGIGYVLPGIGHRFAERNDSFRTTKPILCVLYATKLYWQSLTCRPCSELNKLVTN